MKKLLLILAAAGLVATATVEARMGRSCDTGSCSTRKSCAPKKCSTPCNVDCAPVTVRCEANVKCIQKIKHKVPVNVITTRVEQWEECVVTDCTRPVEIEVPGCVRTKPDLCVVDATKIEDCSREVTCEPACEPKCEKPCAKKSCSTGSCEVRSGRRHGRPARHNNDMVVEEEMVVIEE